MIENMYLSKSDLDALSVQGRRVIINSHKLGDVGDTLTIVYRNFKLTGVHKVPMVTAASRYYRLLGYESPREFIEFLFSGNDVDAASDHMYVHYFDIDERPIGDHSMY